jgi:PAS domain S-box-containing protein
MSERTSISFESFLEAVPDAMICIASDGRIVRVNHEAERLFGYERGELIDQHIHHLLPSGIESVQPGLERAAQHKSGSVFPADLTLSTVDSRDGKMFIAAIRDATERVDAQAERERLQRQLQQSRRLESLGQLAGGVAHDFNNLLSVILNYTTFVSEEVERAIKGPDGDTWRAVSVDLNQVRFAAERAAGLTHQLLAFARREITHPRNLCLNDIVRGIDTMLQRTLGSHIELVTSLSPDLWSILADPGQIEQILVNLAVNARDAMPEGGTLRIETENVAVVDPATTGLQVESGAHVRLRVSDTGTGMSPEVVERAFEPFFTTKGSTGGSGLGLATVYGIVTQSGGDASIESFPYGGTTFSALFPAFEASAVADDAVDEPHHPRGVETILVVEDERAVRELTQRILVRHGYRVITARHGAEALNLAETYQGSIDLLLTDVVMPQMLGHEVAERFVELRPASRVLFMSGYAQPLVDARYQIDPDSVVEKPFTEPVVLNKIRQVLDAAVA